MGVSLWNDRMKTMNRFILFLVLLFSWSFSFAGISKKELKSRKCPLTSKVTHRRLSRAQELISLNRAQEAISILKRLIKSTKARPYEKAQALNALGIAYAHTENYQESLKQLQKVMDLDVLAYNDTLSALYAMAQVNAILENYNESLKKLDEWFSLADMPGPDAYALKASMLAHQKKSKQALKLIMKAISMTGNPPKALKKLKGMEENSPKMVEKPKEPWLVLAVAMNYELRRFKDARILLETLTSLYPEKKKYWKQLAAVYINLERNPRALSTMELAHKADYLDKDSDIMNLVSLLIYGGIPLKGARILEAALNEGGVEKTQRNYEILGDAWAQSEELDRALNAYAQSATMAKDGRIFAKQGRIYMDQENWKQAAYYLSMGLKKGKIKNLQNVYMALGVSQFHLGRFDQATQSFGRAKRISKKVKSQADQWIRYVKVENTRVNNRVLASSPSDENENKTASETLQ